MIIGSHYWRKSENGMIHPILHSWSGQSHPFSVVVTECWPWWMLLSFFHIICKLFYAWSSGISLCAIFIVVFVLFNSGTVVHWVYLFSTLIALLILPILFIKSFICASFIISISSAFSFTSIFLWKLLSFGCRHFGRDYFSVFILEMKSFWTGFRVHIVLYGKFILKFHLQLAMLSTTLSQ